MKDQLIFDTTSAGTIAASDSVGAFVRSSDGTLIDHANINSVNRLAVDSTLKDGAGNALSSTGGALDVNIVEGINVEVDLSHVDDSVRLGDGTTLHTGTSVSAKHGLDVYLINTSIEVTATDLDIRPLTNADVVTVEQGTSPWVIGDGGGSITVDGSVSASQSGAWTVGLSEDHNYGAVGASTLRTAAQIGNATGAADFGSGAVSAQTLRVAIATGTSVEVNDAALANTAIANNVNVLDTADVAESAVASALSNRKYLWLYNNFNKRVFIGGASVSAANGFPMSPKSYMMLRAGAAIDVKFVGEAGDTPEIRHLEIS